MKKWLIILILLIFSNSAGFCNVDLKTENEIKQQEKTNDKQVESVTGAALNASGVNIAATTPKIVSTIISSASVKPLLSFIL